MTQGVMVAIVADINLVCQGDCVRVLPKLVDMDGLIFSYPNKLFGFKDV